MRYFKASRASQDDRFPRATNDPPPGRPVPMAGTSSNEEHWIDDASQQIRQRMEARLAHVRACLANRIA